MQRLCNKYPAPERSSWSDIHITAAAVEGLQALVGGRPKDGLLLLTRAYDDLLSAGNSHGALRVGLELAKGHFLAGNSEAFDLLAKLLAWAAKAKIVSFLFERPNDFAQLVTAAQAEKSRLPPELQQFLRRCMTKAVAQGGAADNRRTVKGSREILSPRERWIIEFIAGGQSNKQIARTLGMTPKTIKTHVKRIFIKLSAETRAQAVVRAQSLGFLTKASAN